MPRTLPADIAALAASGRAMLAHALYLNLGGVEYFLADRAITFAGQAYEPALRLEQPTVARRSLAADTGSAVVENVSSRVAQILRTQYAMGDSAELRRLWLGASAAQVLSAGRISAIEAGRDSARIAWRSRLDPRAQLPIRKPAPRCGWAFKGPRCGFVGAPAECDKTTAACVGYSNIHRFGGFPTLTRELEQTVPPAPEPQPTPDERDFLGDYYGEEEAWY